MSRIAKEGYMKKIFLALFIMMLCETSFAQDSLSTANFDSPKPKRNSFYLNTGIGFGYTSIYFDHRYDSDKIKYDGSAFGFAGELTMGLLIKGFVAVHGSFEFLSLDGKYDLDKVKKNYASDEIDDFAFLGGVGATVYPFLSSSKSFFQEVFFSAKFDLGLILINDPFSDYSGRSLKHSDYFVFGVDLETGKDWQISERFFIGVGLKWQLLSIISSNEVDDVDSKTPEHKHLVNSIQLMLRFNRK